MAQGVKKYFHMETCFTLDCANLDQLHGAPNDRSHFWSPLNQRWDATDLNPFWERHDVGFIPLLKEWLFWPVSETLTNIYLYRCSLMDRSAGFYKPPWNKTMKSHFLFFWVRKKSVWTTLKCFYSIEHRLLSDETYSVFLLIEPRTHSLEWTKEDRCREIVQNLAGVNIKACKLLQGEVHTVYSYTLYPAGAQHKVNPNKSRDLRTLTCRSLQFFPPP